MCDAVDRRGGDERQPATHLDHQSRDRRVGLPVRPAGARCPRAGRSPDRSGSSRGRPGTPAKDTIESNTPSEARMRHVRRRRWCAGRTGSSRRRERETGGTGRWFCRRGWSHGAISCAAPQGGQVRTDGGSTPGRKGHPKRRGPAPSRFRRLRWRPGEPGKTSRSDGADGARCAGRATGRFVRSHGHTSFHACHPKGTARRSLRSPHCTAPVLPLVVPRSDDAQLLSDRATGRYRAVAWT